MSVQTAPDRYHALDSLRAFAMFLGIVLHATISFMANPPAFWPVRDTDPILVHPPAPAEAGAPQAVPIADLVLLAIHDFRMQLFFLLAGFFACLLYHRYGLGGLTLHRLQRVAVPLALSILLIIPTVMLAAGYAEIENVRAESVQPGSVRGEPSPLRPFVARLIEANRGASTARLLADWFLTGEWFVHLRLLHLWFLYYLLIYLGAVVVLAPLFARLTGTRLLARIDAVFRRVVEGRGRVLIPALLTFPLMLPMKWVVDTQSRWVPEWHIVGYYFAFFGFGWMLYRHRDLVPAFGRRWRLNLALANLVALPAMIVLLGLGFPAERSGADVPGTKLAFFGASVLYTWLMITGLWGAFLRLFAHASVWARYLADSAYWCYLASLTVTVVFQFLVRDWPLPGALKCTLVIVATMAVLLASYEWLVRYTFVGAVLNGRKYRNRKAHAQAPPAEPGAHEGEGERREPTSASRP